MLLTVAGAPAGDPKKPALFTITTRKPDDGVKVGQRKEKTVFAITSPSGISHVVIERLDERWPNAVVVRLRLKTLEGLQVAGGKVLLSAAVSLHEGKLRAQVWKDGKKGAPLDRKNPYWMDIRGVGADGNPAESLPLRDGYFEMALPQRLLADNPKSIRVTWIDAYRN
jgi:hypothetical protein